jgi:Type IX secretion system protein PorV
MKNIKQNALILLMSAVLVPLQAQIKIGSGAAQFLGIGVGARAVAMGGANVAIANGASAAYWNPGSIVDNAGTTLELSNAQWFVDSQLQNLAGTLNMGTSGTVGLNITALNYGDMEVTSISRPEGTGEIFSASDLSVGLSLARKLTDRFSIGGTGKYVRQKIWNEKAAGIAMDLGVVYKTDWKNAKIGMSISNFGTDMKLEGRDLLVNHDVNTNIYGNNGELQAELITAKWVMPLTYRLGFAVDAFKSSSNRLTLTTDGVHSADNVTNANTGLEYGVNISQMEFALRGGFRQAFANSASDGGWTAGAGLKYMMNATTAINIDVAYQSHEYLGNRLVWSFGTKF